MNNKNISYHTWSVNKSKWLANFNILITRFVYNIRLFAFIHCYSNNNNIFISINMFTCLFLSMRSLLYSSSSTFIVINCLIHNLNILIIIYYHIHDLFIIVIQRSQTTCLVLNVQPLTPRNYYDYIEVVHYIYNDQHQY